mmetsp:Transcript_57190/g.65479  ORF Transcript_57190/g.65479 Transcript_57190/m.65479 type:complete len:284 (-) Transcript_57190:3158-4009(-)
MFDTVTFPIAFHMISPWSADQYVSTPFTRTQSAGLEYVPQFHAVSATVDDTITPSRVECTTFPLHALSPVHDSPSVSTPIPELDAATLSWNVFPECTRYIAVRQLQNLLYIDPSHSGSIIDDRIATFPLMLLPCDATRMPSSWKSYSTFENSVTPAVVSRTKMGELYARQNELYRTKLSLASVPFVRPSMFSAPSSRLACPMPWNITPSMLSTPGFVALCICFSVHPSVFVAVHPTVNFQPAPYSGYELVDRFPPVICTLRVSTATSAPTSYVCPFSVCAPAP